MTDRHVSEDYSPVASLIGSTALSVDRSWTRACLDAGGIPVFLCLLWEYCALKPSVDREGSSERQPETELEVRVCMCINIALEPAGEVLSTHAHDFTQQTKEKLGSSPPQQSISITCARQCLRVLGSMLRVSLDLREQFLQCHGAHKHASDDMKYQLVPV
jgi:hypothetical protein